ncbi:MAG TPA: YkgJ family cysteine cluster protein [Chroococcales cyanobacterium]|jgi:Fe-S-cluster containining protein
MGSWQEVESTVRDCHALLKQADNINESGDERDLAFLIDRITEAFQKAMPEHPCRMGCPGEGENCCHHPEGFRITSAEWGSIRRHLLGMPPEKRTSFKERAEAILSHHPQLPSLERLWSSGYRVPLADRACPFLYQNVCQVYPVRPLVCRAYGFFVHIQQGERTLSCCEEVSRKFQGEAREGILIPVLNRFFKRLARIQADVRMAPIAYWIFFEGWGE